MNIIDHNKIISTRKNTKSSYSFRLIIITSAILLFLYSIVIIYRYNSVIPEVKTEAKNIKVIEQSPIINWPKYGQSAIGDVDSGVLADSGNQTARPIASTAKIMTALSILKKKPMSVGSQGETITLSIEDVTLYDKYISNNGSVVSVVAGEKITQYQGLQAMLLPSANNMSDSMARWAFGSIKEYTEFANSYAKSIGMNNTIISDASGFSPQTVSTARDLIILGQAALKEPVIAEIINQRFAEIPVEGQIRNVNTLLGYEGINGIKTGNTDEAGGCFLASAVKTLSNGQKKIVIAAVLGASERIVAMNDSKALLEAVRNNYTESVIVKKGDVVGYLQTDWGQRTEVKAKDDFKVYGWTGKKPKVFASLNKIELDSYNEEKSVGQLIADDKSSSINVSSTKINPPDRLWLLKRAMFL